MIGLAVGVATGAVALEVEAAMVTEAEVEGVAALTEVDATGDAAVADPFESAAVGWYLLLWLRTELWDPNFLSQMLQAKSLIFKWTLFLWV